MSRESEKEEEYAAPLQAPSAQRQDLRVQLDATTLHHPSERRDVPMNTYQVPPNQEPISNSQIRYPSRQQRPLSGLAPSGSPPSTDIGYYASTYPRRQRDPMPPPQAQSPTRTVSPQSTTTAASGTVGLLGAETSATHSVSHHSSYDTSVVTAQPTPVQPMQENNVDKRMRALDAAGLANDPNRGHNTDDDGAGPLYRAPNQDGWRPQGYSAEETLEREMEEEKRGCCNGCCGPSTVEGTEAGLGLCAFCCCCFQICNWWH